MCAKPVRKRKKTPKRKGRIDAYGVPLKGMGKISLSYPEHNDRDLGDTGHNHE